MGESGSLGTGTSACRAEGRAQVTCGAHELMYHNITVYMYAYTYLLHAFASTVGKRTQVDAWRSIPACCHVPAASGQTCSVSRRLTMALAGTSATCCWLFKKEPANTPNHLPRRCPLGNGRGSVHKLLSNSQSAPTPFMNMIQPQADIFIGGPCLFRGGSDSSCGLTERAL